MDFLALKYEYARLHWSPDVGKTIRCRLLYWSPDVGKIWSGSLGPATWGLRLPSWGDFGALTAWTKVSALGLILCRVSITGLGLSATPDRQVPTTV